MKLSSFVEAVARLGASDPDRNKLSLTLIDDNNRVVAHRVFSLEECRAIENELVALLAERIAGTRHPGHVDARFEVGPSKPEGTET